MLSTPKAKGGLFLASSLCDGLEDYNIRQVATLLLNKDADPNVLIPTHGVTPFHLVIGNDSEEFAEEVTKLFLRHGGNPNVRSNDGMTPVHVAAAWGRINILQLLLANGGDPLCVDNDGRSPFHYAFEGKYFKVVTMLSNYCENIQDEDDKPKYNMVLDKVLITNGDKVAEYVASKDILLDLDTDKMTKKSMLPDFHNFEPNSSSMIVDSSRLPDMCNVNETKSKLSIDLNKCFSKSNDEITAQQQNNLSWIDKKEMTNYSFIDLDFDFANLHLTDVMQKEKCLVSQIISHLSSSLANCTINDTLHNYKRNKLEESSIATSNFDTFQLNKNTDIFYKHEYYKNPKSSSSRLQNNFNKDILRLSTPKRRKQCSKYNAQSTSKKKYKKLAEKISSPSTYIFNNNSIVSMSPNFNTPNHRKRRNIAKTPLTLLHIHNDSIVSKSPNFATLIYTSRKNNSAKTSHSYFSPKLCKKSQKCKTQTQSEFNWYEKHIAQSTPRRKKRSIYKFRSSKKRFDPYRYESDITSDESSINNILKSSNLDKTIFSEANETTTGYDILNISECSSSYFKKPSKIRHENNCLAIKLDDGRYDEDDITCDNSNINILNSSFNQTNLKENESINNSSNNKKYAKSVENNKIDDRFVTIRRDIFKTDKMPKTIDISIDNVNSTCTIETDSLHKKNFVDCVDCDTKKLLNEDINISKTCNVHAKNWYNDRFHESSSHKLIVENNSLTIENLPIKCKKHASLSEKSCSSKINKNNIDSKKTEVDMPKTINLDVYEREKSSSLLSYISTMEEYKYEDPEEGITLLERRFCVISFNGSECSSKSKILISRASSTFDSQNLPMELFYIDDATLRTKLKQLGDEPGPITNTTRQVYLKRLMRLTNIRDATVPSIPIPQNVERNQVQAGASNQINAHLQFGNWLNQLDIYKSLERDVFQEFSSPDPSRRWREGMAKTSFTYLLLDPRITQDLPNRAANLTEPEVWSIFLNAIFYIGKGKRSRPFSHLYDAFHAWTGTKTNTSRKVGCILDIWDDNCGVICLHVFQNIIPVEAYTREAVMIDAIGKEQLGNCISGKYYGIAATWSMQQKQKFGRYLLYKALQIFIQEGESQVFPQNLG